MKIIRIIIKLTAFIKDSKKSNYYEPKYRIVETFKDEEDNYKVMMQIINKNITFYANPEDILANDKLIDSLSPRDVRTLTYLGYLSLNQPKYKILAQKFSANSDIFVLKKRGEKKLVVKTASEIIKEQEILDDISPQDAKTIGYTIANNEITLEKTEKEV